MTRFLSELRSSRLHATSQDSLGRAERSGQRVDFVLERLTELRAAGLLEPRRIDSIEHDRAGVGQAEGAYA